LISKTPRSISYSKNKCSGCGICEVACSLYHENECNPSYSRLKITKDFLSLDFNMQMCVQCKWPSCFFECSHEAIKIDKNNGTKSIDHKLCKGCGKCTLVCPLMPDIETIRSIRKKNKKVYFKCDLCMGRKEGPICVEICPRDALIFNQPKESKR
jgi:Fe-S-cluster-containing hydrogenase component 2